MAYQPKSHRKFLATSLSAALVATVVAPTAGFAAEFPDVSKDHQYYSTIQALADAGVVTGMPNGNFDLGGKVTRAQASQMVAKILKLATDAPATPFKDVKKDAWYTNSINALYAAGSIKGLDKDTFAPDKTMTRAEFAQLIVTAYDIPVKEAKTPFTDVKAGAWYQSAIETLYANGLIKGQTATSFGPNETIKRGDFAYLLANTDYKFGDTIKAPGFNIVEVTALDDSNRFLSIQFSQVVSNLEASDITVQDTETQDRYGVKEVKLSSNGKTATVELFSTEANTAVLQDNHDYTVTVNANGEVLTKTFNRPAYTKEVVTAIDVADRTFAINGRTIEVPKDVEFDFYSALGREARVWYNKDFDLVKYVAEEQNVVETSVKVTKERTIVNSVVNEKGEVEFASDKKKYKLASDFTFFKDGDSSSFGSKDQEYDYAKVIFNKSGDIKTIIAYDLVDTILVSKVDGNYIFGYDNEDLKLEDYVIAKDGKSIKISDIKKDDLVFFNPNAEEDGVAIVTSKTVSGNIDYVFTDSFDVDGKNYKYGTGEYLKNGKDIKPLDDNAAEKLQAGGKVTVYLDYKGDVAFVKGTEGVVEDKYSIGALTDVLLPYFDNKKDGYLELNYENKAGEKLYDFKIKSLKEIVIQASAGEYELQVKDRYLATYPGAVAPQNGDTEIDEFRLAGDGTVTPYSIIAVNKAGQTVGTVVDLTNYNLGTVGVNEENGVVKGLKFNNASSVALNHATIIESKDKYAAGHQLTDDTIVFDINVSYTSRSAANIDAKNVTVTTWGELKKRNVDIAANTADIYFDEKGVITHLAVYKGIKAADAVKEMALITRVDKNTDNEIVRIQALVNGVAKSFTADKLTGSDLTNITVAGLGEGDVVELELNGTEVTKINANAGQTIAGLVEAVRVGDREVDVRVPGRGLVTVELASDGGVYEAKAAKGSDYKIKNIRDIKVNDKVVIGLAEVGSRFAEAIVIASDAVVTENGLSTDVTAPTVTVSPAKFTVAVDGASPDVDTIQGSAGAVSAAGATVRAYIWNDANSNGVVDAGELSAAIILGSSVAGGSVAAASIGDLAANTYKLVITATDANGNESAKTAAAATTITLAN
ncbi:S-layer homology domain-containing protein [Peribacillus loiseleuriae]|uniref:S-layer homology domain-containing protein n=1 Tax=Peribacillus loiseleuriae TaxID=1679170 RepID=UPI0037F86E2E